MLLLEELVLPLIQELLCTPGTWSGSLKSSSCSCANTSALARKGEKNTLLGRNEDQTALFNGSVHLCWIKAQPSCGFKRWWKHRPVIGIATCMMQLEGLGLSKGSGTLKTSTAQSSQCRKLLDPPPQHGVVPPRQTAAGKQGLMMSLWKSHLEISWISCIYIFNHHTKKKKKKNGES